MYDSYIMVQLPVGNGRQQVWTFMNVYEFLRVATGTFFKPDGKPSENRFCEAG
jgi:hypothetical protein